VREAKDELTPSERVFVDEYLVDRNGTRAYRAAFPGVAARSARTLASRLLAKVHIRDEIRAARRAQQIRTKVTADGVIRELSRIAFSDLIDYFDADGNPLPPHKVPRDARRAIAAARVVSEKVTTTRRGKTTTRVRTRVLHYCLHDKCSALDELATHLGVRRDVSPLEALLGLMPPGLAAQLRAALAQYVEDGHQAGEPGPRCASAF
jgi:phage terminase small subunit